MNIIVGTTKPFAQKRVVPRYSMTIFVIKLPIKQLKMNHLEHRLFGIFLSKILLISRFSSFEFSVIRSSSIVDKREIKTRRMPVKVKPKT